VLKASAWEEAPAALRDAVGATTAVVVPVATARGPFGTLSWFVTPSCRFQLSHDLSLMEEVARRSGIALENAELFRRTRQAIRARDEFLAVASHELKTPLTPLRLNVQTLKRLVARTKGALPHGRVDEMLSGADRQIRRLAGLVDDLLDATRMDGSRLLLDRRPLDLSATVVDIVERYAGLLAEVRCPVSLDVAPDVVGTWDRVRVEQIVTNLLSNGMKYASGTPLEITVRAQGAVALLRVRDHGPGIAPEDQERIFRPYERAVSYVNVSGFGLGLYIVRQIAEAHGGVVRLDSTLGDGSAFTVELPFAAPAACPPKPHRPRSANPFGEASAT
jgi:signal transduction histidine kinase